MKKSKQLMKVKVPPHPYQILKNGRIRRLLLLSNTRPERMQKLKVALNLGQNPGFEYLLSCWDDPALQIVIKKLLAKYPQWGVACEVMVEVQ
ncbi:hypothetical protein [Nostoc sp. FACHB-888]|uniref:hypothetical protein n=1 Tax=Nostoc sp. FACHB-888 TaxID=2692842 RepID=UPI00168675E6|nr:hypothetical protein [Nostoc sp. FACHB-888]MBD2248844.1 hypothetical protein [Nostoc sp. FACHB-888]